MRSDPPDDDLTARARIRDAAIERFAADGFRAGLRTIAADAGVSPGLVIHHFGSKDALRRACDDQVLRRIREIRADALSRPDALTSVASLASDPQYAFLATYLLRSLQAGGDVARQIVADLVAETRDNLERGVQDGTIVPSRDPDGRADLLTRMSLGYLLLEYALQPAPPADLAQWVIDSSRRSMLAGLETFTEGLFAGRGLLDTYLAETRTAASSTSTPQEDR